MFINVTERDLESFRGTLSLSKEEMTIETLLNAYGLLYAEFADLRYIGFERLNKDYVLEFRP